MARRGAAPALCLPFRMLCTPASSSCTRSSVSLARAVVTCALALAIPALALAQTKKPAHASSAAAASEAGRWTAATPDEMAKLALRRARAGGDDALAALVVAASLDERAS